MSELRSVDGRYLCADQGDGNFVVYDTLHAAWVAVWDRWSYEAAQPQDAAPPPPPADPPPTPIDIPAHPAPLVGAGHVIRVTDERDGDLINRGYSYFSQVWINGGTAYAFVGHQDGVVRFFEVDLSSGAVKRLRPLLGGDA